MTQGQGIRGGCREGQRRVRRSSRGGAGGPETSPEGRRSRRPLVRLLHVTRTAARAQCEKAIDAFLSSIERTLQKHVPVHAQGPLISNALSTAFQFQMSVWRMIGEECIRPVRVKHSDWCGLAGIVHPFGVSNHITRPVI